MIMMRKSEQPRAANFSRNEEGLLLRIVNSHSSVIENKKTDAVTNAMKITEWKKVEEEFNAETVGQTREAGTLRRKYENMKRCVKKKLREGIRNVTKPGDGSSEKVNLADKEIRLLPGITPQALGFQSKYGSKYINHGNSDDDIENESYIVMKTDDDTEANDSLEIPASPSSVVLLQSLVSLNQTTESFQNRDKESTESFYSDVDQNKNNPDDDITTESFVVVKTEIEETIDNKSLEIPLSPSSVVLPDPLARSSNADQLTQSINEDNHATQDKQITSFLEEIDKSKDNGENNDTESFISMKNKYDGSKVNKSLEISSSSTSTVILPQSLVPPINVGKSLVGQATIQPKASRTIHYCNPMKPPSFARSSHGALRARKRDCPLKKMSAWKMVKADINEQEQIFSKELHEQKKRHLEEEHALRLQLLEQQLRCSEQQLRLSEQQLHHAEEQQSWLREEHLEKINKIKSSS